MLQFRKSNYYLFFSSGFSLLFLTSSITIGTTSTIRRKRRIISQTAIQQQPAPQVTKSDPTDVAKKKSQRLNTKTIVATIIGTVLAACIAFLAIKKIESPSSTNTTTPPPVKAPPVKAPPVKAPPVKAPPVKAPPVKAPPVKAPPVKAPPAKAPTVKAPTFNIKDPRVKKLLFTASGIIFKPHFEGSSNDDHKKKIASGQAPDFLIKTTNDEEAEVLADGERCKVCYDDYVINACDMVNACEKAFKSDTSHRLCLKDLYQTVNANTDPTCFICQKPYRKDFCESIKALCGHEEGKKFLNRAENNS